VTDVWVHDVPGPPHGDFWDPPSEHLLGAFVNPASIYPDVMLCARQYGGGKPTCTAVCWDLQGDTKLGGSQRSKECQRPLRITLPAKEHRMQLRVSEMNRLGDRVWEQAIIAEVGVTDPAACPHRKPCEMKLAKGSLVLSFGAETPARSVATSPSPKSCEQPSQTWSNGDLYPQLKGLHGPYASVDAAVIEAGNYAWQRTGPVVKFMHTGTSEWGFLILRDKRQAKGGYYTTPPVRSSVEPSAGQPPRFPWDDYATSGEKALSGSCETLANFTVAATVHTHPFPITWGWDPFFIDNFSMDDFNQGVQFKNYLPDDLKNLMPDFEKIVMINARDRKVRTFSPLPGDRMFEDSEKSSLGILVQRNERYQRYAERVRVIFEYPEPK
jgi:hypothetical protein